MVNVIPKSLKEALEFLQEKPYTIIAGGTDLMVQKRGWSSTNPEFKQPVLFIANLAELNYVKVDSKAIFIGATTTLSTLLNHPSIPDIYKDALFEMASVGIRNSATIAGNIANASPAGDSLPVLYALNAVVVVQNIERKREIAIKDFITGVRKITLQEDEMITEIIIPKDVFTHRKWVKVGGRRADAISKISFVGLANIKNKKIIDFRIALGAVAPTVVRQEKIEAQCIGKTVEELQNNIEDIVAQYQQFIVPITDQRSTKAYREQISHNIIVDFIKSLSK